MRTYITAFMLVATLGLVSCGGGNDVASSGASAVSAATSATTPDVTPNTTATTPTVSTPTKPKINGQIDERTGVAPLAAQMTISTATAACVGSPVADCFGITSGSVCKSSYNANRGLTCQWSYFCYQNEAHACTSSVYVPVVDNPGQCLLKSFPACTQAMFGKPSSMAMWYVILIGGNPSVSCVYESALLCPGTCPTTDCGGGGGGK